MTLVVLVAACGGSAEDGLGGTWLRTDDHGFVLTVKEMDNGYLLTFENTANGDKETVGGIRRSNGQVQAALTLPGESAGALEQPDETVPIMLVRDGRQLVVRSDADPAGPVELWRYERP